MKKKEMLDELTEAMHSEFGVDPETERQFNVWAVCREIVESGKAASEILPLFDVREEDFLKHRSSWPYFEIYRELINPNEQL